MRASIHLPRLTDTFMFHGWVMYRHLKEQKLALFTSLGTKGNFWKELVDFKVTRPEAALESRLDCALYVGLVGIKDAGPTGMRSPTTTQRDNNPSPTAPAH